MKHFLVPLLLYVLTSCVITNKQVNKQLTCYHIESPVKLAEVAKTDPTIMAAIEQVRVHNVNNRQDKAWLRYTPSLRRDVSKMTERQQAIFAAVVMITCSHENGGLMAFNSLMFPSSIFKQKGLVNYPWQLESVCLFDPITWLKQGFIGQAEAYFLIIQRPSSGTQEKYFQIRDLDEFNQYPRYKVPACLMKLVR